MSKIFFDSGVSLDGFIAGENRGPKNPIGDNGPAIHQWMYKQKAFWKFLGTEGGTEEGFDNDLLKATIERTGAYIMGKRMFDEGEVHWPEDLYKAPVYVLTNEKRDPWVQKGSTTFYFINDGIYSALEKAKANSNGKDIRIQGGADVIQQFLNAGLVDEFTVHMSPIVIGSGIRLFDKLDRKIFKVEIVEVHERPEVIHTKYRVINKKAKVEKEAKGSEVGI